MPRRVTQNLGIAGAADQSSAHQQPNVTNTKTKWQSFCTKSCNMVSSLAPAAYQSGKFGQTWCGAGGVVVHLTSFLTRSFKIPAKCLD